MALFRHIFEFELFILKTLQNYLTLAYLCANIVQDVRNDVGVIGTDAFLHFAPTTNTSSALFVPKRDCLWHRRHAMPQRSPQCTGSSYVHTPNQNLVLAPHENVGLLFVRYIIEIEALSHKKDPDRIVGGLLVIEVIMLISLFFYFF